MNNVATSTPIQCGRNSPTQCPDNSILSSYLSNDESILHTLDQNQCHCSQGKTPTLSSSSSSSSSLASSSAGRTQPDPQCHGMKIVGDNIDKNVHTRFMRCDHQTTSLHYFHAYATQDRFDLTSHPEELPSIPKEPALEELLYHRRATSVLLRTTIVFLWVESFASMCHFFPESLLNQYIPTSIIHWLRK